MKKYLFSFVGQNKNGERVIEDIMANVPEDVEIVGVKEQRAMALEIEFGHGFRCVEIREVCDG